MNLNVSPRSPTKEKSKQLYDVYQKLLEERIISEIGDDEIIAHYEIVTQQKSFTDHLKGDQVVKVIGMIDLLKTCTISGRITNSKGRYRPLMSVELAYLALQTKH